MSEENNIAGSVDINLRQLIQAHAAHGRVYPETIALGALSLIIGYLSMVDRKALVEVLEAETAALRDHGRCATAEETGPAGKKLIEAAALRYMPPAGTG